MVATPESENHRPLTDSDMPEIRYELKVYVDDEEVYTGDFFSKESLQESGLRKADHQVQQKIAELQEGEE